MEIIDYLKSKSFLFSDAVVINFGLEKHSIRNVIELSRLYEKILDNYDIKNQKAAFIVSSEMNIFELTFFLALIQKNVVPYVMDENCEVSELKKIIDNEKLANVFSYSNKKFPFDTINIKRMNKSKDKIKNIDEDINSDKLAVFCKDNNILTIDDVIYTDEVIDSLENNGFYSSIVTDMPLTYMNIKYVINAIKKAINIYSLKDYETLKNLKILKKIQPEIVCMSNSMVLELMLDSKYLEDYLNNTRYISFSSDVDDAYKEKLLNEIKTKQKKLG